MILWKWERDISEGGSCKARVQGLGAGGAVSHLSLLLGYCLSLDLRKVVESGPRVKVQKSL